MSDMQTDVEVLKTELRNVLSSVVAVSAKVDILISLQGQLIRLEAEQGTHRRDIDNIGDSVRVVSTHLTEVDAHKNKAIGGLRVLILAGGLIIGLAQFYMIEKVRYIENNTTEIKYMDRRMAAIEAKLWPDTSGGAK
jgi:hypothetical protein